MTDDKKPDGWILEYLGIPQNNLFAVRKEDISVGLDEVIWDSVVVDMRQNPDKWRIRPVKLVYLDEEK